jgi:uncharacterized membrane protein YsdA (DUF1294 family)/cold shock CspA family protein
MRSSLSSGKLTRWNDTRGFGFIQPADKSQDVFLHISEIKDATRRPQDNDTIYYYRDVDSDGRICACNAFILGARNKATSPPPSSHHNVQPPKTVTSSSSTKVQSSKIVTSDDLTVEVAKLLLIPFLGIIHFMGTTQNILPLLLYPGMSFITYNMYADDKARAKRRDRRIPEKTLHLCELVGGWPGGFIAQRMLRHKNRKDSYQFEFWAIVAIHYIGWIFWLLSRIM